MGKKNKKLNKRKKPAVVDPDKELIESKNMEDNTTPSTTNSEVTAALQGLADQFKVHIVGTITPADPTVGEKFDVTVTPTV